MNNLQNLTKQQKSEKNYGKGKLLRKQIMVLFTNSSLFILAFNLKCQQTGSKGQAAAADEHEEEDGTAAAEHGSCKLFSDVLFVC